MIIEFTGIPCSGKSTLCNQLLDKFALEKNRNVFVGEAYVLKRIYLFTPPNALLRTFLVDLFSGFLFVINYNKIRAVFIRKFFTHIKSQNSMWLHKINLCRNVIKKLALNAYIRTCPDQNIYIFHEGITHIFQNLYVDHAALPATPDPDLLDPLHLPNAIILIVVKLSTARERLAKRGHRRISGLTEKELSYFLQNAKNTIDKALSGKKLSSLVHTFNNEQPANCRYQTDLRCS